MITDLLFVGDEMPLWGFLTLYAITTVLLMIVYNLGFARKLPVLKSIIVYIALAAGAFPLAFLGIALPVVESLLIATVVLTIVRLRMKPSGKGVER